MQTKPEQLRSAPLPRMAGRLSYMRSKLTAVDALDATHLAVLGIPMEREGAQPSGCSMGPLALRETSVYYGWFNNPQFASLPVDVHTRTQVDTSSINTRLVDIGDIHVHGLARAAAETVVTQTLDALRAIRCPLLILGGDDSIVYPVVKSFAQHASCGFVQVGGLIPAVGAQADRASSVSRLFAENQLRPAQTVFLAPVRTAASESLAALRHAGGTIINTKNVRHGNACSTTFADLAAANKHMIMQFDLSACDASIHGMTNTSNFYGLNLPDIQNILAAAGRTSLDALIVTGLNPCLHGLGVVKTGQRLLATALLTFIYSRLGLPGR